LCDGGGGDGFRLWWCTYFLDSGEEQLRLLYILIFAISSIVLEIVHLWTGNRRDSSSATLTLLDAVVLLQRFCRSSTATKARDM
jgi:hypothetical protein